MIILKYVHFVYVLLAVLFAYDGLYRINNNEPHPWLSFIIAACALFMFFFRRKFSRKFAEHYKKNNKF